MLESKKKIAMKLLIVDDNVKIRNVIKDILNSTFDEIIEHDDGEFVERVFSKEKPDYILMDVKMNRIDGITATRNILSYDSSAKIIIISQHNDDQTIDEAYAAGAIKFFGKENLTNLVQFFQQYIHNQEV